MPLRPYTVESASQWLILLNVVRDKPLSLSEFDARERSHPPSDFRFWLLFEENTETLGIGQIAFSPYIPADHLSVLVLVAGTSRRQGIGGAVLEGQRDHAQAKGYRGLACYLHERQAGDLSSAIKHGFREHVRRFESRLDLTRLDKAKHQAWMESVGPQGINFSTMDDGKTGWDDLLLSFRDRVAEGPDLEHLPAWDVERCRAVVQTNPQGRADWIAVAKRDTGLAGVAVMHRLASDAYHYFVGVAPR